jgi:hypothetical protein
MDPRVVTQYRNAPDKATREALEFAFPGVAAEAAHHPVEAAAAREVAELREPMAERAERADQRVNEMARQMKVAVNELLLQPEPAGVGILNEGWHGQPPLVVDDDARQAVADVRAWVDDLEEKPAVASDGPVRRPRGRPRKVRPAPQRSDDT